MSALTATSTFLYCTPTAAATITSTVYTTVLPAACETGIWDATYVITDYCHGGCGGYEHPTIPPGFTVSTVHCPVCPTPRLSSPARPPALASPPAPSSPQVASPRPTSPATVATVAALPRPSPSTSPSAPPAAARLPPTPGPRCSPPVRPRLPSRPRWPQPPARSTLPAQLALTLLPPFTPWPWRSSGRPCYHLPRGLEPSGRRLPSRPCRSCPPRSAPAASAPTPSTPLSPDWHPHRRCQLRLPEPRCHYCPRCRRRLRLPPLNAAESSWASFPGCRLAVQHSGCAEVMVITAHTHTHTHTRQQRTRLGLTNGLESFVQF
ncbi:hypothetical protein MN608_05723 [Microdochium nivale]|nr:hypothetical protein MN608_05723 [Microdochium nivale]